jgi:hypothetical protein
MLRAQAVYYEEATVHGSLPTIKKKTNKTILNPLSH